jgi:CRP-like cAMP-binding protein
MQELITYLQQFKRLSAKELELIRSKTRSLRLEKGDYLSWKEPEGMEEAQTGAEIAFVCEGILRAVHVNPIGVEITEFFIDEGHFIPGPEAGDRQPVSPALRQALIRTELSVISRTSLEELSASIPAWDPLFSEINVLIEAERTASIQPALAGDATACYKEFLQKYPQIAARIPLSYLASYLGITQQSFSRVRQKLAKNTYRPAR